MSARHIIRSRLFRQHKGFQSPRDRQLAVHHRVHGQSSLIDQHRRTCDTCWRCQLWYVVATLFHINWFYATHWNFRHFSKLQRIHIACYCCTTNKNAPPRLVEISSYDGATILLWSCLSLTVSGRLLARETDRWACMKAECTTCVELEWYIWPRRYANVIVFGQIRRHMLALLFRYVSTTIWNVPRMQNFNHRYNRYFFKIGKQLCFFVLL